MGHPTQGQQDGVYNYLGYRYWHDCVRARDDDKGSELIDRWDFVIGLLFGIILACIFFVVQSSRRRPIRVVFDGATAKSTVRRPRSQRAFIQQVGSQTCVMKLQGFREYLL